MLDALERWCHFRALSLWITSRYVLAVLLRHSKQIAALCERRRLSPLHNPLEGDQPVFLHSRAAQHQRQLEIGQRLERARTHVPLHIQASAVARDCRAVPMHHASTRVCSPLSRTGNRQLSRLSNGGAYHACVRPVLWWPRACAMAVQSYRNHPSF